MAGAANTQPSVPGSDLFVQCVCPVHINALYSIEILVNLCDGHRHIVQKFKTLQKILRFEMMLLGEFL